MFWHSPIASAKSAEGLGQRTSLSGEALRGQRVHRSSARATRRAIDVMSGAATAPRSEGFP